MRVLFLAPFGGCRHGTVRRRLWPLARALAARGHQTALVIPAWDCPDEDEQSWPVGEEEERGPGPTAVIIPPLGPGRRGVYPLLGKRLRREIAAFRPDVLIVSKGLGYAGWAARWWWKQGGRVVVDVDDLEQAWQRKQGRHPGIIWMLARQEQVLIRDATGVMVASRFLQSHWTPARGAKSPPYYLPNGLIPASIRVPVETYPPRVLLPTRGHDVDAGILAQVWPQIHARVPRATLFIVGGWRPSGFLPQAHVLGWLSRPDYLQAIRSAAMCLFLPQKKPLVQAKSPARVLDCLAHGVPVLTLDVGEYAAMIRHTGGDPAENPRELLTQCVHLLVNIQARGRMSETVFARMPRLSWAERAASLESWLQGLMPPRPQEPLPPRPQ